METMSVETMHVENASGKGFFLRRMYGHYILGISTIGFQRQSAFFELENRQSGERNSITPLDACSVVLYTSVSGACGKFKFSRRMVFCVLERYCAVAMYHAITSP
jgi:hypothetical protein